LELCDELLVPSLANIIRREEKRVIKIFNLYFAMSTDASLDLGASPVSPVRASDSEIESESTNLSFMVVEDSRDHVPFPVCTQHVPIVSLLRDCLRTLGSPSDDPGASTNEVFLVVIVVFLDTDRCGGRAGPLPPPPMTLGLACVSSQLGPNRMV
jgi:hypothetical protein